MDTTDDEGDLPLEMAMSSIAVKNLGVERRNSKVYRLGTRGSHVLGSEEEARGQGWCKVWLRNIRNNFDKVLIR